MAEVRDWVQLALESLVSICVPLIQSSRLFPRQNPPQLVEGGERSLPLYPHLFDDAHEQAGLAPLPSVEPDDVAANGHFAHHMPHVYTQGSHRSVTDGQRNRGPLEKMRTGWGGRRS